MKKHARFFIPYFLLCALIAALASWFWPNDPASGKNFFYYIFGIWSLLNVFFMWKLALPKKQDYFSQKKDSKLISIELLQDVLKFPVNEWDEIENKLLELTKNNQKLKDELLEEKTKFQLFIKSFPSPVFIINQEQQIIFMNNRLREVFHFHAPLSPAVHLLQVLRDHSLEELTLESRKQKNVQTKEVSLFPLNDQNKQFYTAFTSYLPVYGNFQNCVMGFLIETTELKLTTKMREEFVANVSHEIRTPLTILMGQLQLLEKVVANIPEAIDLSQNIQRNSKRLLSMMNELLELSKLESQGRIQKELIEVDILIESILFDLQEKYKHLNIEMLTCFDTHL